MSVSKSVTRVCLALAVIVIATGCAPSIKVRQDSTPAFSINQYQTYDFFTQLGIEGENTSDLFGQHFRAAIEREMSGLGLRKSDNPQLQVNVTAATDDKVRVNTYTEPYLYGGYYAGPRGWGGYYDPFYPYGGRTTTRVTQYTEATVYIDFVDAAQHKMVWQGAAQFNVTDKVQQNLRQTVDQLVAEVMAQLRGS